MKMKIKLINIVVNTQDDKFFLSCTYQQRLCLLERVLCSVKQSLQFSDQSVQAILVAPEYFFARSCPEYYLDRNNPKIEDIPQDRVGRHYEYDDYIEIRKELTKISDSYHGILIVPGTIAWKERVVQEVGEPVSNSFGASVVPYCAKNMSKDEYKVHMMSIGEGEENMDWEKYMQEGADRKLFLCNEMLHNPLAKLIGGKGIELVDKLHRFSGLCNNDPEQYIHTLKERSSKGTIPYLAWNSAFFYLDGKKRGEYSKHSDYQEIIFHEELSVAISSLDSSVLNIEGLNIGIEICLDHYCNVLGYYMENHFIEQLLDIHLVLSASVEYQRHLATSIKGYFIHSSSFEDGAECSLIIDQYNKEKLTPYYISTLDAEREIAFAITEIDLVDRPKPTQKTLLTQQELLNKRLHDLEKERTRTDQAITYASKGACSLGFKK